MGPDFRRDDSYRADASSARTAFDQGHALFDQALEIASERRIDAS
jgi:hypothetical protein